MGDQGLYLWMSEQESGSKDMFKYLQSIGEHEMCLFL